jgi:hypothetical protein
MVKITGVFVGPNPAPQFLPRDYFTRVFQQSGKNLKWLLLEFDPYACFAHLSGAQVNLEDPESYGLFSAAYFSHTRSFTEEEDRYAHQERRCAEGSSS